VYLQKTATIGYLFPNIMLFISNAIIFDDLLKTLKKPFLERRRRAKMYFAFMSVFAVLVLAMYIREYSKNFVPVYFPKDHKSLKIIHFVMGIVVLLHTLWSIGNVICILSI